MAIHDEILETARRMCRERGERSFRVSDIVQALPHLNPSSVRTHVVSRCCVNAPKNHPHKWDYFRRTGRGEYVILSPFDAKREPPKRVAESPSTYAPAGPARDTIHVVVRRSGGFYVAETLELALVTQGRSLDELLRNLKQAVRLHLEGEDPKEFGLTASPRIALTYEEGLSGDGAA
jgi:predicted RNase H-like HicB family nuclease